jgi:5'-deoxynucleotidase YfbR-like HD superfamily hydrolase
MMDGGGELTGGAMAALPTWEEAPRDWVRMLSGRRVHLFDPSPLDIEIDDYLLSLARECRWSGQTLGEHGLSVLQHQVLARDLLVARLPGAPPGMRLAALVHDFPEAILKDLASPVKERIGRRGYDALEERHLRAVHIALGLPAVLPPDWAEAVRRADMEARACEALHLAGWTRREIERAGWLPRGTGIADFPGGAPQPPSAVMAEWRERYEMDRVR